MSKWKFRTQAWKSGHEVLARIRGYGPGVAVEFWAYSKRQGGPEEVLMARKATKTPKKGWKVHPWKARGLKKIIPWALKKGLEVPRPEYVSRV